MRLIRMPKSTKKKLAYISSITEPEKFLPEIVDLFENYYEQEESVPTRYCDKTGKVIEREWRPRSNFEKTIILHHGLSQNIHVSDEIRSFLEQAYREPIVFFVDGQPYVIMRYHCSYNGSTIIGGVFIQKALTINNAFAFFTKEKGESK